MLLYSVLSLILAVTILVSGIVIHSQWTLVYIGLYFAVALTSFFFAEYAALIAAVSAVLTGWLKTTLDGYNVDIGIGLVSLAVSVALVRLLFKKKFPVNVVTIGLLLLAGLVIISSAFTVSRVIGFQPIAGFEYHNYAYNAFGFPSDDVLQHVLMMTANLFSWLGIYLLARLLPWREPGKIRLAILALLLVNSTILIIQQFVDPAFLIPAGFPVNTRLNGITSYCYSLGAFAELIFLLAPIWFFTKKSGVGFSLAISALVVHAIILSGSRTAIFNAGAVTLIWLIFLLVKSLKESFSLKKATAYCLVVAALLGVGYIIYELHPADLNSAIGRIKLFAQRDESIWDHFVRLRLRAYPLTIRVIADYPLTGVGIGSYYAEISKQHQLLMPEYQPAETYEITSNSSNFYIGLASELGILAPIIFVTIIIVALFANRDPQIIPNRLTRSLLKISLIIYSISLLLGPQIYNSEATPWFWMLVAAISSLSFAERKEDIQNTSKARKSNPWIIATAILLLAALITYDQFRTLSALDPIENWKKLRYHLDIGFYPPEEGGRWSDSRAAMVLGKGNFALIRWHTGDSTSTLEREVRFGIEGEVVRKFTARNRGVYETLLPLPSQPANKRLLTIQVDPPFIPSSQDDKRTLGIFIHSIKMMGTLKQGIGFWDWERLSNGRRFRWSKQVSYLPLSENGRIIAFSIKSFSLPDEFPPQKVTVSIDGKVIREIEPTAKWQEIKLDISKIARTENGIHLLRFEADRSYQPAKLGLSDDTREIAFAITGIRRTRK